MNIHQKIKCAQQAIVSITSHDDAPFEEVTEAVAQLSSFAADQLKEAEARRAEKSAAEEKRDSA